MQAIHSYSVAPALPEKLLALQELSRNMWWCWCPEAIELFQRLDRKLWEQTQHNPVRMLGAIDQNTLRAVADDESFIAHLDRVREQFNDYLSRPSWYSHLPSHPEDVRIAYFSAEYGIHESLPIYSGGLGMLAGDHIKSASDLGLPMVGVGLLYRQGYFRQYLNADGWQQELYPENDFYQLPFDLARTPDGQPAMVQVELPGRNVQLAVWVVNVGRVPVYMLDSNLPENRWEDRTITAQLYGGDEVMRIRQEIVLGIGGIRALRAVGIKPTVCHMNEGHSAFLALERIRLTMQEQQVGFADAREATVSGNVFTTHTPVPAGNDRFAPQLMDEHFRQYYPQLGLTRDAFLTLGREKPANDQEPFCMTVLALKLAAHRNGVSKLHGVVSRRMWQKVWPQLPQQEIPITSISNGVHIQSWISHETASLLDRYLGPKWSRQPEEAAVWRRMDQIPDTEMWRTHERRRERLVAFARRRLRAQLQRRGAPQTEVTQADEVLDPEALTIGFARRFATYKRGTLLFRDMQRMAAILSHPKRPVQIIFAGKSHPRDGGGKDLIRQIIHHAREEPFRRRVVFLEDYDVNVARYLVQGVDVWLNTPRRPLEASGTSGMKASANGALNVSTLDGWWCEGYQPEVGWAIGRGEEYTDHDDQDEVESHALYDLLEKEIIPLFYDRGSDGLPRGWIAKMKAAMKSHGSYFNTSRMVRQYAERCYLPAAMRSRELQADHLARASALAQWRSLLEDHWADIRINDVRFGNGEAMKVGDQLDVEVDLQLGQVPPEHVAVELFEGPLDASGHVREGRAIPMQVVRNNGTNGEFTFIGRIPCQTSGLRGCGLRVLPNHPDVGDTPLPGLILWAS